MSDSLNPLLLSAYYQYVIGDYSLFSLYKSSSPKSIVSPQYFVVCCGEKISQCVSWIQ